MSLKDLLAISDDKLHEIFEQKAIDPKKAREAFAKRIDKTAEQFASATPLKGRKMFVIKNGIVKVTLPFAIEGKNEFLIPSERFKEWLGHLRDSVTKGELDDAMKTEATSTTNKLGIPTPKVRKVRGPLSPEKLAARRAKVAAREAAAAKK